VGLEARRIPQAYTEDDVLSDREKYFLHVWNTSPTGERMSYERVVVTADDLDHHGGVLSEFTAVHGAVAEIAALGGM
jgi:hypothetical protein